MYFNTYMSTCESNYVISKYIKVNNVLIDSIVNIDYKPNSYNIYDGKYNTCIIERNSKLIRDTKIHNFIDKLYINMLNANSYLVKFFNILVIIPHFCNFPFVFNYKLINWAMPKTKMFSYCINNIMNLLNHNVETHSAVMIYMNIFSNNVLNFISLEMCCNGLHLFHKLGIFAKDLTNNVVTINTVYAHSSANNNINFKNLKCWISNWTYKCCKSTTIIRTFSALMNNSLIKYSLIMHGFISLLYILESSMYTTGIKSATKAIYVSCLNFDLKCIYHKCCSSSHIWNIAYSIEVQNVMKVFQINEYIYIDPWCTIVNDILVQNVWYANHIVQSASKDTKWMIHCYIVRVVKYSGAVNTLNKFIFQHSYLNFDKFKHISYSIVCNIVQSERISSNILFISSKGFFNLHHGSQLVKYFNCKYFVHLQMYGRCIEDTLFLRNWYYYLQITLYMSKISIVSRNINLCYGVCPLDKCFDKTTSHDRTLIHVCITFSWRICVKYTYCVIKLSSNLRKWLNMIYVYQIVSNTMNSISTLFSDFVVTYVIRCGNGYTIINEVISVIKACIKLIKLTIIRCLNLYLIEHYNWPRANIYRNMLMFYDNVMCDRFTKANISPGNIVCCIINKMTSYSVHFNVLALKFNIIAVFLLMMAIILPMVAVIFEMIAIYLVKMVAYFRFLASHDNFMLGISKLVSHDTCMSGTSKLVSHDTCMSGTSKLVSHDTCMSGTSQMYYVYSSICTYEYKYKSVQYEILTCCTSVNTFHIDIHGLICMEGGSSFNNTANLRFYSLNLFLTLRFLAFYAWQITLPVGVCVM